ncbi:MAG: serine/threonine protein kinase [Actinobacteria bacterium]|nr:serine/threonine protein kinase [Actinomycetota bacterium]
MIGRGGSAQVWLAWPPDRPEPVALKRAGGRRGRTDADPVLLRHEAEALARVRHPGVVALLDVVDDPPGVALVLPHLAGGSLRQLLAERGTLLPGELVAVASAVAAATAALARVGLVHGDLKPEHVCFDADGTPVLVDLGSASAIDGDRPAEVRGTPAYLDPAVAAGGAPGPRSEVFALGVVAYEALTGRLPHRGDPAHAVAAAGAGAHRSLRTWPAVPVAVADVVERALAPDPTERPADPVALVAALRAVVPADEVVLPGPARLLAEVEPDRGLDTTTLRFGAAPPSTPTAPGGVRPRAIVAAVGAGASLAALVVGAGGLGARPGSAPGPAEAAVATAAATSGAPCPPTLPPAPPGVLVRGDLDGDGCDEAARWTGTALVAASATGTLAYRVDAPGAHLLLGDWDGDGRDAPALYDPATGATRLYDRLPAVVGQGLGPSRVVALAPGGRPEVVPAAAAGDPDGVHVGGG